ncbi:hypothetical protein PR202_gb27612 [Eleusine coracana subsp. coracana]|uniref:RING-type E3 ubiquitin transferase n=1 Tax=Eleusine coracana subsp. coracana TaxID=191504 RepID=A0AAV5FUZ5_ELECO|nr:hypothetical protein QOZ80_6AG0542010 [Eleusine coracana subsp. coracana]GJN38557.1 hypothetical protein PR202_gb27612 [Eleusine coracana subsp. coracana]
MCRGIPSSSEPPSGAPPHALFISVAVGLFLICFVVLLASAFAFLCRRRSSDRTSSESEYNAQDTVCSARRQKPFPIETLPAFTYAHESDGIGGGGGECSVCLGTVREGEMVRRLPACLHVYHVECIDRWLAAHRTCPVCRSKLDHPCKPAR